MRGIEYKNKCKGEVVCVLLCMNVKEMFSDVSTFWCFASDEEKHVKTIVSINDPKENFTFKFC